MIEKLCIFCQHCDFVDNRRMGSEWTGEYGEKGLTCERVHFDEYEPQTDVKDIRALYLRAECCPDYLQIVSMPKKSGAA